MMVDRWGVKLPNIDQIVKQLWIVEAITRVKEKEG